MAEVASVAAAGVGSGAAGVFWTAGAAGAAGVRESGREALAVFLAAAVASTACVGVGRVGVGHGVGADVAVSSAFPALSALDFGGRVVVVAFGVGDGDVGALLVPPSTVLLSFEYMCDQGAFPSQ